MAQGPRLLLSYSPSSKPFPLSLCVPSSDCSQQEVGRMWRGVLARCYRLVWKRHTSFYWPECGHMTTLPSKGPHKIQWLPGLHTSLHSSLWKQAGVDSGEQPSHSVSPCMLIWWFLFSQLYNMFVDFNHFLSVYGGCVLTLFSFLKLPYIFFLKSLTMPRLKTLKKYFMVKLKKNDLDFCF